MKRLVSRVLARRVVAEVEQICGLKMPLESTRQLVEQQNWRKNRVYYGRLFCGAPAAALDETEA